MNGNLGEVGTELLIEKLAGNIVLIDDGRSSEEIDERAAGKLKILISPAALLHHY
jgi:hypothetical protein